MTDPDNLKLAVLIDADNAQAAIVEGLLAEIAKYGTAHVKRIYGDWTLPNLGSWKETLLTPLHPAHAAVPLHQGQERHGRGHDDRRHGPAVLAGTSTVSASFPATVISLASPHACANPA